MTQLNVAQSINFIRSDMTDLASAIRSVLTGECAAVEVVLASSDNMIIVSEPDGGVLVIDEYVEIKKEDGRAEPGVIKLGNAGRFWLDISDARHAVHMGWMTAEHASAVILRAAIDSSDCN